MADNYDFKEPGVIDDRFPFDLTKSLDYNIEVAKKLLVQSGMTEEEAEKSVKEKRNKYFNEDGTRKDGKDRI